MGNFALFTYKPDNCIPVEEKLLNRIRRRLKEIIAMPKIEAEIENIKLYEDLDFYVIKLPYSAGEIGEKSGRIARAIEKANAENAIDRFIAPSPLSKSFSTIECAWSAFDGNILYRSLLLNIIDAVYSSRGINVCSLDIVIIHGNRSDELYAAVDMLAPSVRYITIITEDKEPVENEINKICIDTGLSVRVTNDYKSGMKSADLVVNFSDSKECIFNYKSNPWTVIINYGEINFNKILTENVIINGIDVCFPKKIAALMDKDIYRCYDKAALAEVVLGYKTGCQEKVIQKIYDYDSAKRLSEEFVKRGFSINGFFGRRNMFKAADIKLPVSHK